jgi:AraC family transcriptional regulator
MSNAIRIAHGEFGRVALLDMDGSLVRHAHPHCHVLIKAHGADTQFSVRDRIARLTDDSAVLINAWEPHAYVHDPARERTTILALYIEPRWLSCFRPNWGASGGPGFFTCHAGGVTPRIRHLAGDLSRLMLEEPGAGRAQQALLSELMIAVIERFTDWRRASTAEGRMDWRIRRAIATIRQEPGAIADIGRLARDSGLSRAHFFRLFEQATGMPPRMFANMLRLESAVAEVMEGGRTMAEVSDELGFSAPAHFTRFFRDHAGAAPREFRAIARLQTAA